MATIKDIAKIAGVSVTTVSRALNGYSDVNENTRKKIEKYARELNYSPNTLARSLVMNKSNTIGILVSGLEKESVKDNFIIEILTGVNDFVSGTEYDLILFNTNSSKQREKTYTQLCNERKVDGIILQGIRIDDPYLKEVVEGDIPCVLIDIPITAKNVGYVTTNNKIGAKNAVKHLIELGHTNIGLVNGHEFAYVSQERLEGYKEALLEANIHVNQDYIVNGNFREESAKQVVKKLLENKTEITALFCASDLMAIGAMNAAKEMNRSVPEDLSIIGYDDILQSSYVSPRLTTVAQNKFELGFQAAKLLLEMLEEKDCAKEVVLESSLIVRDSTAIR
ncbi:LacI family DNA-binding transcriptional regulator [Bacillus sp. JJ1562]|uniref:LacI family DNA-binding transcriptional regulator n=1 Tax=Bacillus sp. JJ1562 TaxID=3122960 RepID=UPI0030010532